MYTLIHTRTHIYLQVHIHKYTHTHTHTHIHTHACTLRVQWAFNCFWWQRPIGCLIFIGRFPQKSPTISGSFAERDLQFEASHASSPTGIHVRTTFTYMYTHVYFVYTECTHTHTHTHTLAQTHTPHTHIPAHYESIEPSNVFWYPGPCHIYIDISTYT